MNWFALGSIFIQYLYIILKLTAVWWLFNIPYAFLGVSLFASPNVEGVQGIVIIGALLLPFIAVPATTATLAITRRYIKGDDSFSLLKEFWRYYKREYGKSVILGGVNVAVIIVFYIALRYYAALSSPVGILFYALVIVTPFFFLYIYSFLVDQELPLKTYLANTMFLWLEYPLNAFFTVLDIAAVVFVLWMIFPPLLIFIMPGFTAIIVTYFYQRSMSVQLKERQTLS